MSKFVCSSYCRQGALLNIIHADACNIIKLIKAWYQVWSTFGPDIAEMIVEWCGSQCTAEFFYQIKRISRYWYTTLVKHSFIDWLSAELLVSITCIWKLRSVCISTRVNVIDFIDKWRDGHRMALGVFCQPYHHWIFLRHEPRARSSQRVTVMWKPYVIE